MKVRFGTYVSPPQDTPAELLWDKTDEEPPENIQSYFHYEPTFDLDMVYDTETKELFVTHFDKQKLNTPIFLVKGV